MSARYYGTAAWKRLRAQALIVQPFCATPGCGRLSLHVDHIVPRTQRGLDALSNLRGLCASCHANRWRGTEPRAKGCDAAGKPRDPKHWWNDTKSLRAERLDRPKAPQKG